MKSMTAPDQAALAPADLLDPIVATLRAARRVQICGHVRPDGDCIGSMLAVHHLLGQWGIAGAMAASAIPASGYDAMPGFDRIRERPADEFAPDLTVFVDCATEERGPDDWRSPAPIVNIDHHATNTRYGVHNWIEPRCSSAGEMMFYFLKHAGASMTPEIAAALLVALTTDTGSFRFANTGSRQHWIAAQLIEAGADPVEVARMAYGSVTPAGARLTGHVLADLRLEAGGRLAWSEVRQATYRSCGGERFAPENLCDSVRNVRGVELALLFHEKDGGGIRANLRSGGPIDVSRLAGEFGGGGHAAAAGLTIEEGDYDALRDKILRRALDTIA
jgi:phosphoesterase RecJ-like protein